MDSVGCYFKFKGCVLIYVFLVIVVEGGVVIIGIG